MSEQIIPEESSALRDARNHIGSLDERADSVHVFYVERHDNPLDALVKIRSFLARETNNFDRTVSARTVAQAVIGIDRVLDTLNECRIERVYRRTK